MRCYRRILVVKRQDRRTNEEIRALLYNEKKQWWIQSEWGSSNRLGIFAGCQMIYC